MNFSSCLIRPYRVHMAAGLCSTHTRCQPHAVFFLGYKLRLCVKYKRSRPFQSWCSVWSLWMPWDCRDDGRNNALNMTGTTYPLMNLLLR